MTFPFQTFFYRNTVVIHRYILNKLIFFTESYYLLPQNLPNGRVLNLQGVNRAFPYVASNEADDVVELQTPILFQLVRLSNKWSVVAAWLWRP